MIGVFAGGGLLASIEALVVPQLKLALHIGYAEALLVQLTYYSGYLLFAWPAAYVVARLGAMRSTAFGLAAMAFGCSLLAAAELGLVVAPMLAALFLLSAGVTLLQIACNGVMATHGGPRAASRFTLLQAFNSVGTTVGPVIGATFLLEKGSGGTSAVVFLAFAGGFGALAVAFTLNRALLAPEAPGNLPSIARLPA